MHDNFTAHKYIKNKEKNPTRLELSYQTKL